MLCEYKRAGDVAGMEPCLECPSEELGAWLWLSTALACGKTLVPFPTL